MRIGTVAIESQAVGCGKRFFDDLFLTIVKDNGSGAVLPDNMGAVVQAVTRFFGECARTNCGGQNQNQEMSYCCFHAAKDNKVRSGKQLTQGAEHGAGGAPPRKR
ncbi:MAG: hypothetical protein P1R58_05575 [bacterium]|nr:hypothetical protein [bacterium]